MRFRKVSTAKVAFKVHQGVS